jgi:hypothetical protein
MSTISEFGALLWAGNRRWVFVTVLAAGGFGCWQSGSSGNPILLPDDNDFLSYWQCAEGLVIDLQQVRSRDEFRTPRLVIGAADPKTSKSLKDRLDAACDKLEAYQEKLAGLPDSQIKRLTEKYADLVKRVQTGTEDLSRRHAANPQILDEDWNRYRQALQTEAAPSR